MIKLKRLVKNKTMKKLNLLKKFMRRFKKASKNCLLVGLTGQVACGKTTVLNYFKKLGALTISTDEISREVLTSKKCYNKIVVRFGSKILLPDKSINRDKLSKEVFASNSSRKWLENLLHPKILEKTISLIENFDKKIVIVDVPLLFETGIEDLFDLTIAVHSPKRLQFLRGKKRAWTKHNLIARMKSQFPSSKKTKLADIVINNDKSLKTLYHKVQELYSTFKIIQNNKLIGRKNNGTYQRTPSRK